MGNFSGQKVVISGATRGIGKALVAAFLAREAIVIGTYSSNEDAAENLQKECERSGHSIALYKCDVAAYQEVGDLYLHLEETYDSIDVLINNAGIRKDALTALMSQDQWQSVIDVNLTGTFNMSKCAVPLMLKQKYGRIITITSPVSHLGFQGQANYAASKAGQIGLTKTLAKETARKKITVNCVSPGFIKTDFIEDLSDEQLASYKKLVPMRRFGTVEEVASAVLFLASQEASYITGATLEVTGGI